jgi:HEAT repeat protein
VEILIFAGFVTLQLLLLWLNDRSPDPSQESAAEHDRGTQLARVQAAFTTAARQMNLKSSAERRWLGARLEGYVDRAHVMVQCTMRVGEPWLTTITVRPRPQLPHDVWFRSFWRTGTSLADAPADLVEPVTDTGDPAFDRLIAVGGHVPAARALLSAPARRAILTLVHGAAVRLGDGEFVREAFEQITSAIRLTAWVRDTLAALKDLRCATDVAGALAEAAHSDPEPGVRARCLATLIAEEPDRPRTSALLDSALADPSDAVRVAAARALGERGLPVLREIATRSDSEEEPAARAVSLLARRLSSAEALAILDSSINAGRHTVALAVIELLGRLADDCACERLCALLHVNEESLAVAAANALGFVHSSAAEEALLQALESRLPQIRHAAVLSLGRVGRVASLAPLRAMADDDTGAAELAAVARQAVAAIEARLPGASRGQVSLAEGEAGHVSLASDALAGRVSISSERSGAS